jgi:hypothetical protein
MGLGHAVLAGGISGLSLFGANLAAASYTFLKLGTDFFAGSSFERIGATAENQRVADHD